MILGSPPGIPGLVAGLPAGGARPPVDKSRAVTRGILKPLLDWRANRIARVVGPCLATNEVVLDFGTGDGVVARAIMRQSGCHIIGLDTICYGDLGFPFIPYDGVKIPLETGSVDTVMALLALHHCGDVESSLAECVRVARRRLLIVEEVYKNRAQEIFTKVEDWIANRLLSGAVDIPLHFRPLEAWRATFTKLGLKVERETGLRPLPFVPLCTVLFEAHKAAVADAAPPAPVTHGAPAGS